MSTKHSKHLDVIGRSFFWGSPRQPSTKLTGFGNEPRGIVACVEAKEAGDFFCHCSQ